MTDLNKDVIDVVDAEYVGRYDFTTFKRRVGGAGGLGGAGEPVIQEGRHL